MKRVSAIVRPEKLEELKDVVNAAGLNGMTVYQVQGCGNQRGWKEYVRGNEVMLNMIPKVKVELVVNDDQVEPLIDLICQVARTGEVGDGKIFIYPVEECVRIRTGERGEKAV
ncbi:MAG: P-II family nitrogen regulator [Tractidigestivibacter sp.]|jgi:nitrogen regulatory protein P-II 1|uniref:P-II family nitrogen regulator n=1 Tax=Tractidigestivibacter sp. TaxID=2847320 RepID=UPI003D90CE70